MNIHLELLFFWYRIATTSAGVTGLLIVNYWYIYGDRKDTVGNLERARKVWSLLLVVEVIISFVILLLLVIVFKNMGIAPVHYLIIFGALSLHTSILFFLCTFFLSPRAVKYVVPFKRISYHLKVSSIDGKNRVTH